MGNQANRAGSEANVFITFKLHILYLNTSDMSAHSLISYVAAEARAMLLLLQ